VQSKHVPYRSTPQSVTDIMAGHVAFGFAEAGAAVPLIKEGKLRAMAVSSKTRLPILPEVPPFAEAPAPTTTRPCPGMCCSHRPRRLDR
jgi:tripartite-type tricarboxylate transporter receptor subunit TctC